MTTTTSQTRRLKRKKPTTLTLTPISVEDGSSVLLLPSPKRNQLDDKRHEGSITIVSSPSNRLTPTTATANANPRHKLPLEAVFLNRYRRIYLRHVNLCGWDASDSDVKLLEPNTGHAIGGAIDSLTLDECTHISVDGMRFVLPALTANRLRVLSLKRCTGLNCEIVRLLPSSLVQIDFSYCEWLDDNAVRLLSRQCPSLRTVSLVHCRQLTDYGVTAFADCCTKPLINSLDISQCFKVSDTGVLALLLRCNKLRSFGASNLVLMEGHGLEGIARMANTLEHLNLSHNTRMHSLTVAHLVTVYGTHLVELEISHCPQITDETLVALGRSTPNLGVLKLAFCIQITDHGLIRLVEYVALESESLADYVDQEELLPRCTRLKELDVSGCYQLTSAGIGTIARSCAGLQVLRVNGVRRLDTSALRMIADHCPAFHTLEWSGILIQGGGRGNDKVQTNGFTKSNSNDTPKSTSSGFFSVPNVDRSALRAISMIPSLHTLHIGTTKCDVDALVVFLPQFGHRLIDFNVTALATNSLCQAIGVSCHQLVTLRLGRSRYFNEESFIKIARNCIQLRTLDLESCEQIQDQSIHALGCHCHKLEKLVLTNNWQITDSALTFLSERCPSLLRINVRHCPDVSLACLRAIAAHNPTVIATSDGLEPKAPRVLAYVRQEQDMNEASRRITRWFRLCLSDQNLAKSTIERALQYIRKRKRMVVRLQRWFRHCIVCQRERRRVEALRTERRECLEKNWKWFIAFVRGSRGLRWYIRRFLAAQQLARFQLAEAIKARRLQAAIDIERVYRGFVGREKARGARRAALALRQRRLTSSIAIQRIWRGHHIRQTYSRPLFLHWFTHTMSVITRFEQENVAALTLTRMSRGFLGRCRSHTRRKEFLEWCQLQNHSARIIQRNVRAYLVRIFLERIRFHGARGMQTLWRAYRGRAIARHIILTQAFIHTPRMLLLCPHTIYTRELSIEWKLKRDASLVIAVAIQRLYRGYYYGRLLRRIQLANARQLWYTKDRSARSLQHFFRSLMIIYRIGQFQNIMRIRKRGAIKIQSVWRMWQGKVRATAQALKQQRKRKHEATMAHLAMAVYQPSVPARLRLLQYGAVYAIASVYKDSLLQRGWQSPSFVKFLNRCAATIQALVRGHQTRQYVAWYHLQMTQRAIQVQRAWRQKLGRRRWKIMILERKAQQRLLEEEDKAAKIARKLTSQYGLEAYERDAKFARVLQQWYRTLHRRQIFQFAKENRMVARRVNAKEKLGHVLSLGTESAVFQARVWRDCIEQKQKLNEMEEEECVTMEREIASLKETCLEEYIANAIAATDFKELCKQKNTCMRVKKKLTQATVKVKATIHPFAEQAKKMTIESSRVHVHNKQLQDELRRMNATLKRFHKELRETLPQEPLLYHRDIERLLGYMGLPTVEQGGKPSLVQDQIETSIAEKALIG